MSELTHDTTIVADGLALLTDYNRQPNIQALLGVYLALGQELEDEIWNVYESRIIANATGAQLDLLGRIVGSLRNNLGDSDYRTAIKIQIRVNRSQGKASDLVAIGILAGVSPVYTQTGPAEWQVTINPGLPVGPAMRSAAALGTSGDVIVNASGTAGLIWDTVAGGSPSHWDTVAGTGVGKWLQLGR